MAKKDVLHHVILITFLPEAQESVKNEIIERYATLGADCGGHEAGILFWSTKPNTDLRKNIHLVEIAIFKDNDSFEKFKKHPKHIEVLELLKTSANWYVGDIFHEFPNLPKHLHEEFF